MLSKEKIIEVLKNIDKEKYGIKKIGLFGSYAKGIATEESDIDILVDFDFDKMTFFSDSNLRDYLKRKFHKKVDVISTDQITEVKYETDLAQKYFSKLHEEILNSVVYV